MSLTVRFYSKVSFLHYNIYINRKCIGKRLPLAVLFWETQLLDQPVDRRSTCFPLCFDNFMKLSTKFNKVQLNPNSELAKQENANNLSVHKAACSNKINPVT